MEEQQTVRSGGYIYYGQDKIQEMGEYEYLVGLMDKLVRLCMNERCIHVHEYLDLKLKIMDFIKKYNLGPTKNSKPS